MTNDEFIEMIYELEPNLKKEGLENFEGYFVHWNKVIKACGGGVYDQSPLELIVDLRNELDRSQHCSSCKEPLSGTCRSCQRLWES